MATYGYSENKGKHEVYTKEDFAIIEDSLTISAGEYNIQAEKVVDLPDGFTAENSIVLSVMATDPKVPTSYYTDGVSAIKTITAGLHGSEPTLTVYYEYDAELTEEKTVHLKIVLMKI